MPLEVRPVLDGRDLDNLARLLLEAARWLEEKGEPMWRPDELTPDALLAKYRPGEMRLGWLEGEPVATMVLQDEDPSFWPDAPTGEALFLHKLAVARRHAGRGLSHAMLNAAGEQARALGKAYLRLDCAAYRPGLRGVYELYGFRCVGRRMVGPFDTAFYELEVGLSEEV
jgi:GNAT superfamily N-acetyltransferase